MKTIGKIMAAFAMLAVSATASAQFTNSGSTTASSTTDSEGWSTFFVQYNPCTIVNDNDGGEDLSINGLTAGLSKTFGIAPGTPIFIEAGIAVQYSFATWSWKDDMKWGNVTASGTTIAEPEEKFTMFSAKVPVSLLYRWDLPNSSISLAPYAGLDLRYNIFGSMKTEKNFKSGYSADDDTWENVIGIKVDKNPFDKKDMGDNKDNTLKRFQIGWHIGLNAYFNKQYMLGISYGSDFSEIAKKLKVSTTSITLGYCF